VIREVARRMYERLLAPFGARALERMCEEGLPPRLAAPLRFLFDGDAPASAQAAARVIERRRAEIGARQESYRFAYSESALGPVKLAERTEANDGAMTAHRLAHSISIPRRWGIFLHLCAEAFEANSILEMGACVGISSAYLASIRSRPHLITLEGSAPLAKLAEQSLAEVSERGEVVAGAFEESLPRVLDRLDGEQLQVVFVDGHHEEAATLHYAGAIEPHLAPTGLMILDDIYLYEGMWRAWQTLSSRGNVVAVNIGRFGLLVYERGRAGGRRYDLARYTGRWRVGGVRT